VRPTAALSIRLGPVLVVVLALTGAGSTSGADLADSEALQTLASQAPDLNPEVLKAALSATDCAQHRDLPQNQILTVIDYSLPSTEPRLWVFDLAKRELLFHELVAHGVNTGENLAIRFSNTAGTRQSSLGLFLTDTTYMGRNGYSLKLHGLEKDINHNALQRAIVLHGAWYVSDAFHRQHGRLGRSWGCPAVDDDVARSLIDTIKDGSLLFIYYPDEDWLSSSDYLNACSSPGESQIFAGLQPRRSRSQGIE